MKGGGNDAPEQSEDGAAIFRRSATIRNYPPTDGTGRGGASGSAGGQDGYQPQRRDPGGLAAIMGASQT